MAKILIASDIHGDAETTALLLRRYAESGAERLVLLGDILYHGPRNDLPTGYAPKKVIELLNPLRDEILAVRGNCDTEVDQMVLNFPILADYAILFDGKVKIFATHGHHHNTATPPPLSKGDILLHGHTHVLCSVDFGDNNCYINPGSPSLPKENNPKSYAVYEDGRFTVKSLCGEILLTREFI